ncbi:hypothetical protein IAR55_002486 [Kwoniella newhampshirensis]|uniref:Pali-domain-containing protein n=1 Tax=Kwoniella newhampshirensis TaxID=1651941 RepID=A0AAW0YR50_9TREE
MLAGAAFPSFFFTLGAFVLLLLVTLSVPIIKTIYLLHITSSASSVANAGVFGMCYQGGSASFIGIHYSNNAACTHPQVGYTFDDTFIGTAATDHAGVSRTVIRGLAGVLLVNVIACGLSGISLFTSFFGWFCASRAMEIVTFLTLFLSALSAWLAFALDVALALIARHRIRHYTNRQFEGHIGNAVWLALAAAVALTLAIFLAGCGMFGRYGRAYPAENPVAAPARGKRRRFWQRQPAYRGTY